MMMCSLRNNSPVAKPRFLNAPTIILQTEGTPCSPPSPGVPPRLYRKAGDLVPQAIGSTAGGGGASVPFASHGRFQIVNPLTSPAPPVLELTPSACRPHSPSLSGYLIPGSLCLQRYSGHSLCARTWTRMTLAMP